MSNLEKMRKALAEKPTAPPKPPAPKPKPVPVAAKPEPKPPAPPAVKKPPRKKKKKGPSPRCYARLPAGSEKHLKWDGEKWRGTLTIPGIPEPFWFEAGNELKTFRGLHNEYMRWDKENRPAGAGTPAEKPPETPEPVVDPPVPPTE